MAPTQAQPDPETGTRDYYAGTNSTKSPNRRSKFRAEHAIVSYIVLAVAGLIVLRASVSSLAFLSPGWILTLAVIPAIPWLLPRLGKFLREISPYVQSLKLGALQLDFRALRRDSIAVPSSDTFAAVANDVVALSSETTIVALVKALRQLRREGGGPVGIIDLQDGRKWRLPNLYFLARLLEIDPVVRQLVFTDKRWGVDGYFVGTCRPDEFGRQTIRGVPGYTEASRGFRLPVGGDLADPAQAGEAAQAFQALLSSLPQASGTDDDLAHGYITSERLRTIMGRLLSRIAVEEVSETLDEEDVRAILGSPNRFVPTTVGKLVDGFIDREAVALSVARAAVARV